MKKIRVKTSKPNQNGVVTLYFVYGNYRYSSHVTCHQEHLTLSAPDKVVISPEENDSFAKNAEFNSMLAKLQLEIKYRKPDEKDFYPLCLNLFEPERAMKKKSTRFQDVISDKIAELTKPNTIYTYKLTARHVCEFDPDCKLDTMDARWLDRFEASLAALGFNTNGIGLHMRNIRSVFNYARKKDLTTNYPFAQYKIRSSKTRKRSLSIEQLRELHDYPCHEYQKRYRDIFLLMVYLRGINPVDLFTATPDMIVNDRLEYNRTKTGAFISVKIEPEAQAIIDQYRGTSRLLNVVEGVEWRTFNQHMERELKKIGPTTYGKRGKVLEIRPICPDLTPYWSRHTWASLAAECDASKETIAQGLSHAWANVTDTYINFSRRKVDEANRNVIDYINGDYKTSRQLQEENLRLQEQLRLLLERLESTEPKSEKS